MIKIIPSASGTAPNETGNQQKRALCIPQLWWTKPCLQKCSMFCDTLCKFLVWMFSNSFFSGVDVTIITSLNMHFKHCNWSSRGPLGHSLQKCFLQSLHLRVSIQDNFLHSKCSTSSSSGSVITTLKRRRNISKSAQDANTKGEDKKCQTGLEGSSSGGGWLQRSWHGGKGTGTGCCCRGAH